VQHIKEETKMKELSVSRWRLGGLLIAIAVAAVLFGLPSRAPSAYAGVDATLVIDADTSNGSCTTVDATRSVTTGSSFTVALCLLNAQAVPVSGGMNTITFEVDYGPELNAPNVAPDNTTDLDGNPNWNQAGLSSQQSWDCNLVNLAGGAPTGNPTPASIACATVSLNDEPVTGTELLATISFTAQGSGTSPLTWGDASSILSGVNEALCVAADIACVDASITVTGGAPANTSTPIPVATATNTPAPTNTPCVVNGATCTPSAQQRQTVTPTPTVPGEATPGAGETPGAPPPPGTTPPPGGGPGGVGGTPTSSTGITGPDTGDGNSSDGGAGGGLMALLFGGMAIGVAGVAGGAFLRARAARARG
jgi:hypothetical protein